MGSCASGAAGALENIFQGRKWPGACRLSVSHVLTSTFVKYRPLRFTWILLGLCFTDIRLKMTNQLSEAIGGASTLSELITAILRARKVRSVVQFGIEKESGVSIQRARRQANNDAMRLLNELPQNFNGNNLSAEQREILAGYTGEGGLTDGEASTNTTRRNLWLKVCGIFWLIMA